LGSILESKAKKLESVFPQEAMEIVNCIFVKRLGHRQGMGTSCRTFLKLKKEFSHNEINMGKNLNDIVW
jgi:hypothetical protein